MFVPRIVDRICYEQMAIAKHNGNGFGVISPAAWLEEAGGRASREAAKLWRGLIDEPQPVKALR